MARGQPTANSLRLQLLTGGEERGAAEASRPCSTGKATAGHAQSSADLARRARSTSVALVLLISTAAGVMCGA